MCCCKCSCNEIEDESTPGDIEKLEQQLVHLSYQLTVLESKFNLHTHTPLLTEQEVSLLRDLFEALNKRRKDIFNEVYL